MLPAIEVKHVSKRYGHVHALDDIDLKIHSGEFFALLGPNGAGKTTLISIIAGLSLANSGDVTVMGHHVISNYQDARLNLGVVPQELVFDPFFTVREILRIQSGYYGITGNDRWIDEIIERLDLSDKADTNLRALSGGMKRRVLVAQALVHKPPVIILDEPTAGVDVELRQTLWDFIKKLNQEGHTIVLTTHYLEEAETLCNRVAMLKQGKIIALDSTKNLIGTMTSGQSVKLKILPDDLPSALHPLRIAQMHGLHELRIEDYAHIEVILSALRASKVQIVEMNLQQPDLEDVFIKLMRKNKEPA